MNVTAAALLSQARREACLTQRMAAQRAGVAQPTLARVESGHRQPSLPSLDRLLAGCGYRVRLTLEPLPDPHELGLLETTLSLTPAQRIERLVTLHDAATRLQAAVRG